MKTDYRVPGGHIEIAVNNMRLFTGDFNHYESIRSCYIENDTAYLRISEYEYISINCFTGKCNYVDDCVKQIEVRKQSQKETCCLIRLLITFYKKLIFPRYYSEQVLHRELKELSSYGIIGHVCGSALSFTYFGLDVSLEQTTRIIMSSKYNKPSAYINNEYPEIIKQKNIYAHNMDANTNRQSLSNVHQSANKVHMEIKVSPMINFFESCYFKGNKAFLLYPEGNSGIRINCKRGLYDEVENIKKHIKRRVEAYGGSTLHGFINTIIVFYQIVSGRNAFSSVENVLNSFPHQANNAFKEYNIRMEMTRKSLTFTHNGRTVSLEDVADILTGSPQKQKTHKNLSLTEEWAVIRNQMRQDASGSYGYVIPDNTTNFSAVTYICPECRRHISKVLLPEDTAVKLTGGRYMNIDKAFACKYCNTFFAPFSGGRLDKGLYAYLKVNSRRFNEIVQMMDENYRLPQGC